MIGRTVGCEVWERYEDSRNNWDRHERRDWRDKLDE